MVIQHEKRVLIAIPQITIMTIQIQIIIHQVILFIQIENIVLMIKHLSLYVVMLNINKNVKMVEDDREKNKIYRDWNMAMFCGK